MKLYIILKDGQPYYGGYDKDTFVKAYFDKDIATRIAKGACTQENNRNVRYQDYPELNASERDKLGRKLAQEAWESEQWKVVEVEV